MADVLASFAQGWQADGYDVEAIEQIQTEFPPG